MAATMSGDDEQDVKGIGDILGDKAEDAVPMVTTATSKDRCLNGDTNSIRIDHRLTESDDQSTIDGKEIILDANFFSNG